MDTIVVPEEVVVRMTTPNGEALRLPNVLFFVHTFAVRKSNLQLGPFASDENGVVTITKDALLAAVASVYDTGLMDYDRFEECPPTVKVAAMEPDEVAGALKARTEVWTTLLSGERTRWRSIEDIRNLYRTAANASVYVQPLKARWDGKLQRYEYAVVTKMR